MSTFDLATAVLAGLKAEGAPTADKAAGTKHEANNCGTEAGCMGQTP